jgi:hypothetical protein
MTATSPLLEPSVVDAWRPSHPMPLPLRSRYRALIDTELGSSRPRPPLIEPALPGAAADDYWEASELTVDPVFRVLRDDWAALDQICERPRDLALFPAIQQAADSDAARRIASAIERGASRAEGKSPLPPLRMFGPEKPTGLKLPGGASLFAGFPMFDIDRIVRVVAISDHVRGRTADACRLLLSLARERSCPEHGPAGRLRHDGRL